MTERSNKELGQLGLVVGDFHYEDPTQPGTQNLYSHIISIVNFHRDIRRVGGEKEEFYHFIHVPQDDHIAPIKGELPRRHLLVFDRHSLEDAVWKGMSDLMRRQRVFPLPEDHLDRVYGRRVREAQQQIEAFCRYDLSQQFLSPEIH